METLCVSDFDDTLRIHWNELMAILNDFKWQNWREMAFDFVDQSFNVRIPDANLMVKTSAEK